MNKKFLLLFLVCVITLFHCVPRVLGTPIIGGFIAELHSYKYHVSFHKINLETNRYEYFCGGTIIQEKYVLTAAFCFMAKEGDRIINSINLMLERPKIIAGTNNRDGPGIKRDIVTILIPKNYKSLPTRQENIAVVQLKDDLGVARKSKELEMMKLGTLPRNEEKKEAKFCGFGRYELKSSSGTRLDYSQFYSKVNRYLPVTLLDESRCSLSEICAVTSNLSGTHTSCLGDIGAGLIFEGEIVGVLSHGPTFCDSNTDPMVFTRLSSFSEVIEHAMNEHADHSDMHVLHKAGPDRRKKERSFFKCFGN